MPLKRRDFLKGALACSAAGILHLPALASPEKSVDPNRVAMLADTHIRKDREVLARGVCAAAQFEEHAAQILAQPQLPAAAILCGDCAYQEGLPGDYAVLSELLVPLRKAGVPVYLIFGNHDRREVIWKTFPKQKKDLVQVPEEERYVKVLSLPTVHLVLLDSLLRTWYTPGSLGEKQIQWIDEKLASLKDKPVVLMAHHDAKGRKHSLQDGDKFMEVVKRHPNAKAYIFGHLHHWHRNNDNGIQQVGLPASAHVFSKGEPSGWVDTEFHPEGAKLTLHTFEKKHPKRGEVFDLAWKE